MRTTHLAILILGLALFAVPLLPQHLGAQEPAAEEADAAEEIAELESELESVRQDLKLAMLSMDSMLVEHDLAQKQALFYREDAIATLQSYRMQDGEAARDEAKLELQYQKDSLADSEEELRQLSMMYDLNNLADATAQIVMERSARSVDRQKMEVNMAEKALAHYLEFGEPREHRDLEREADLAGLELDALQLAHAYEHAEAERELKDLRAEVAELEKELAESRQ